MKVLSAKAPTTKDLESKINDRRARIAELTARRDLRANDLGTAKEQISQAIAEGKEDTLDALRKNSRACAAEVDELSSAIRLLERECDELTEEARPAMLRETRAEAERTLADARKAIDDLTEKIEHFRDAVIGPDVPRMREKIDRANVAHNIHQRLIGEQAGWPCIEVEAWMQNVLYHLDSFTTWAKYLESHS